MGEDISAYGVRHVQEIQAINRHLTEKALAMRCHSYLAGVKAHLLTATIFEIDSSKKHLFRASEELNRKNEIISQKNRELEQAHAVLEQRIQERTAALERANAELRQQIADRERAEARHRDLMEQFLHAQKMESLGRLAGGIAHDFNNLLSVIISYSEMALSQLPPGDPLQSDLDEIAAAGDRAATLTGQLLALSRKQQLALRPLDLNQVVQNMGRLLKRIAGEVFSLEIQTARPLACVRADLGQIEQVLMNLTINARDAMPQGGRLTIETAEVDLDEAYAAAHEDVSPGRYVMLAVTDSGVGVDPALVDKIFDPFFTTKEQGKGTGLGLSTVHGIVKQHNGHVHVYSELGVGTTFKLYFPPTDEAAAAIEARLPTTLPTGSETVLVVDDEAVIRRLMTDTLQPLGYRVLEAADGVAALELGQRERGIDLLLTDLMMPGMTGRELGQRFGGAHPSTKIAYTSGYPDTAVAALAPGAVFIQKPMTPSLLATKVREALDR